MKLNNKGSTEYTVIYILTMFLILAFTYSIYIKTSKITSSNFEDNLVSSALSCLVADEEIIDMEGQFIIKNTNLAYTKFLSALKTNLNLNNELIPNANNFVTEPIEVISFFIYNYYDETKPYINMTYWDEGDYGESTGLDASAIHTPDGKSIYGTTIYCKIRYYLNGYIGSEPIPLEKECSIGIQPVN